MLTQTLASFETEFRYVIFCSSDPDRRKLSYRLTGRDWSHVLLTMEVARGSVVVETSSCQLDFTFLQLNEGIINWRDIDQIVSVVKFTTECPRKWSPMLYGSCTEMVKSVLGIWSPFIITPKQLYRKLLQIGGEVVYTRDVNL